MIISENKNLTNVSKKIQEKNNILNHKQNNNTQTKAETEDDIDLKYIDQLHSITNLELVKKIL